MDIIILIGLVKIGFLETKYKQKLSILQLRYVETWKERLLGILKEYVGLLAEKEQNNALQSCSQQRRNDHHIIGKSKMF